MICVKAEIPADICDIDDELKAIYHSQDTVCIWVFKTRQDRNNFMDKTAGMKKNERENYYLEFYTCLLYTSPSPRDVEESRMPSSA